MKTNSYLAHDVSRQVKKAERVPFVPRVQHAEEMGDVVCTVPRAGQLKILDIKNNHLKFVCFANKRFEASV